MLAGTLEKRARWRKEWRSRFCVMRGDRIDYFLQPPAIVDEDNREHARGSIPLADAVAVEEPGRPHCIRIGDVLLSCNSQAEQQRWIKTIMAATGASPSSALRRQTTSDSADGPSLMLLPPVGPPQTLQWHEPTTVSLPAGDAAVTVLLLSSGSGENSSCAWALCRLQGLGCCGDAETAFPVQPFATDGQERHSLCVRTHSSPRSGLALYLLTPSNSCLIPAIALLIAGGVVIGIALVAMALVLLNVQPQRQRRVVFSAERLESAAVATPSAGLASTPLWVGRWKLDKSCSQKYEPILADMGVNYLLRKAADSITSMLIISLSESHVTIHVKTLVSVEDCIPLDGSWTKKPVPPGSRMKGELRVRLTKVSASELEMLSEFPQGEGELRDTLTVNEDGNSFTRKVVRGELTVTRVFRRG